ncbi:MAG: DUF3343 domain-containing protein [Coriobacteriaceae bacterium]|nr:DUF3343 domain-containing protein [Coriobacteriaceae bacterium]
MPDTTDAPKAPDADASLFMAFDSTHAALSAQDLLDGLRFDVIATPREIDAGCGMTLRVDASAAAEARRRIEDEEDVRDATAFYVLEGKVYRRC